MEEPKSLHPHTKLPPDGGHPRKPYWKRIHHSFIFWIAIAVMLLGMWIYLRTNDLSHQPNSPPQQMVP